MSIGMFVGYKLIEDKWMIESQEVRRHRAKRINKKWIKRYGRKYVYVPSNEYFVFQDRIVGHPKAIKALMKSAGGSK